MPNPSKTGKTLIEFNCKNGVYNMGDGDSSIKPLGYLASVTTDKNINTAEKYGDGELILSLINDKGSTGTLELTARDYTFEKDLGFSMDISNGLAEVQVLQNKTISVGFECYYTGADGVTKTKKIWLLGVNVAPAGDSLSQNTDGTNESSASYPITIKGVNLKDSDGVTDYTDSNGNTRKVFKLSSVPTDANYSTFLDAVPTPTFTATKTVSVTKDTHTATVTIVNQNNQIVTSSAKAGDVLTITATFDNGYEVDTFTVNGNTFVNGSTHTVTSNVVINVTSKVSE